MDCLKNRIGIKGCGANETGVQLFINQLPGVTMENINALVSDDQQTFLELWKDVVLRTMRRFEIAVRARMNKCFKITDKEIVECLVCENAALFDTALWYLHGVELMIERTSTDEMSRFTTIDLGKAEQLKSDFFGEYETALHDAVGSINPNESDCIKCPVECRQSVNWTMQTP